MTLSSAICRAEKSPVTHEFSAMSSPSQIQYLETNHVAKTELLNYKCTSGAVFGMDHEFESQISIKLLDENHVVTTTAVDSLAGVELYFYPSNQSGSNIQLQLSRDSIHWSAPIVSDGMYTTNGHVNATFTPGRYYVRLTNTSSTKPRSIWWVKYTFGGCNCFLYIPE